MGAQTMACQPLIDFRSFRPWPENDLQLTFKRCRKRQKSIKLGHSSCCRRPRSRSFSTCNHRQSTPGPLNSRRKRNAETRDRMYACGVSRRVSAIQGRAFAGMPQPSRVFSPRSRVCGVSLLATGQGNMRVLLTVADNRKSATARGLNGKMANLFRFAPFRGGLEVQSAPMKHQCRETAQTEKTSEGQGGVAASSTTTVGQYRQQLKPS